MKKQTAVEWLVEQLENHNGVTRAGFEKCIQQAKEMEKQQIIEAHGDKQKTKSNPDSLVTYGYWYSGKDYYNDKYEKL